MLSSIERERGRRGVGAGFSEPGLPERSVVSWETSPPDLIYRVHPPVRLSSRNPSPKSESIGGECGEGQMGVEARFPYPSHPACIGAAY